MELIASSLAAKPRILMITCQFLVKPEPRKPQESMKFTHVRTFVGKVGGLTVTPKRLGYESGGQHSQLMAYDSRGRSDSVSSYDTVLSEDAPVAIVRGRSGLVMTGDVPIAVSAPLRHLGSGTS